MNSLRKKNTGKLVHYIFPPNPCQGNKTLFEPSGGIICNHYPRVHNEQARSTSPNGLAQGPEQVKRAKDEATKDPSIYWDSNWLQRTKMSALPDYSLLSIFYLDHVCGKTYSIHNFKRAMPANGNILRSRACASVPSKKISPENKGPL